MPLLVAGWMIDNALSKDRYAGWERNSVRNSERRWDPARRAKVAIFGSSTSKDWLDERRLAGLLGRPRRDVVDAHINGCHQGCTWAEVQTMLQRGRRYEVAFYGTNLFQLCENEHSKRILQHTMMTPAARVPALFEHYAVSQNPLRMMARHIGIRFSGAYGDTAAIRADIAATLEVPRRAPTWKWYRATAPAAEESTLSCDYAPGSVALKRSFTEGLLDDFRQLADHTYLMLLPDRSRSLDDPEHQRRWAAHMAMHRELADARPWVTIIDLVTDGAAEDGHFRDGFHLARSGMKIQQALFERRLRELGVIEAADDDTAEGGDR